MGTGIMGAPMAMHLVDAGYKVSVYSRSISKAEKLIAKGCEWYDSPASIAEYCDVIFTIVGYPRDVEEVYFGDDGIMQTLKKDTVVIDMTTTLPGLAVRIDDAAREKGAWALDAPVSGGEVGAINGALSVMIGGEEEVVKKVMPIMNVFSKNMVYQGKAGSGQHTKMCNQIVVAGNMLAVAEGLTYARKSGLDPEEVLKSIGTGAAQSFLLNGLGPKMIAGDFAPGFFVHHFIKDMSIALREADAMGADLPGLRTARGLYEKVAGEGGSEDGTQALIKAYD